MDLPSNPILASVARYLDQYGWAAWLTDPELNLIWVSREYAELTGPTFAKRYKGKHYIEATLRDEVARFTTRRSLLRSGLELMPTYIRFTRGGREGVRV